MTTYLTVKSAESNNQFTKHTFTGEAAATTLVDQTSWIDVDQFDEIIVTNQVVKAGTTDTATATLIGTIDGGTTYFGLPNIANTPLIGTATTPSTALTHFVKLSYVFGNSYYGAPKPRQVRVSYSTSGTTDDKNIINGTVILRKNSK